MRRFVIGSALLFGILWGIWLPKNVSATQRCFAETGFCIDGRIREYWDQNGGLPVFGYPIGPEEQAKIEGNMFTVQRFERNRLELHPENPRPYDVLLGRLGVTRLKQEKRDWFTFAKNGDTGGCQVFAETGHAVCGAFLNAFRAHGLRLDTKPAITGAESLALFGLPISDAQVEQLPDGNEYLVQWFERARFEFHPENAAPYDVLFGLLGNEDYLFRTVKPPTATPEPTLIRVPTATTSPYLPAGTLDTFRSQMPRGGIWGGSNANGFVNISEITYSNAGFGYKYVSFKVALLSPNGSSLGGISMVDLEGNRGSFAGYTLCSGGCDYHSRWSFTIPTNSAPAQLYLSLGGEPMLIELRVWPR